MRLVSAITQPGNLTNEDDYGFIYENNQITAAWVLDGVTGINTHSALPGTNDAAWFTAKANAHLKILAAQPLALPALLSQLIDKLIQDWAEAHNPAALNPDYDPPAACLTLVKQMPEGWFMLRLGDAPLLARYEDGRILSFTGNNEFDIELRHAAEQRQRETGWNGTKLRQSFTGDLRERRRLRNKPQGYSILEAHQAALLHAEVIPLGWPERLLLCTDGFYRAVEYYHLYGDAELITAAEDTSHVVKLIRQTEQNDPLAEKFFRFKLADDATALLLSDP